MAAQRQLLGWVVGLCLLAAPATARTANGVFGLEALPQGKSVTLPTPAATTMAGQARVVITPTDMPQTLSLKSQGTGSPLRVAIYDPHAKKPKRIDLRPGTPFLYSFRDLKAVTIVTEAISSSGSGRLRFESNKPLEIAH